MMPRGIEAIVDNASKDLTALQDAGVDAVMFGNENDRPYEFDVDVASTATMAYVIGKLRGEIVVPFGVNVLWDPNSTVALAAATGADFVREIFNGTYASDMGPWSPDAGAAMRYRNRLGCQNVAMLYNVSAEFADSLDRRSPPDRARGAVVAARAVEPDIAIQIDLMLASDTPDTAENGEMRLGGGPGICLYSFHGRGTLNGVIPHPAMVQLFENAAQAKNMPLQRSAQVGVLTDLSYVQTVAQGAASIDIGFEMRYSHSSLEVCDLGDLARLTDLILAALEGIDPDFPLNRDDA